MKTKNGYTDMTIYEFRKYVKSQKVTRKITRLQVHMTDSPSYSTWKNTDLRLWGESGAVLGRCQSFSDYGKTTWGSDAHDGHGHYTAQHFTIFPNGHIGTGRHLNSKPIGIKGWNDQAICIEIYGSFDKGRDKINDVQRKVVLAVYRILADIYDIPLNTTHIKPHAWFTSGGTCLGTYRAGRSRKTCPGTNFFGYGNSKEAFAKFIAELKAFDLKSFEGGSNSSENTGTTDDDFKAVALNKRMYTTAKVNFRKGCGTRYDIIETLDKNTEVYALEQAEENWYKVKFLGETGYISKSYLTTTRPEEVICDTDETYYSGYVKILKECSLRSVADWDAKAETVGAVGMVLTVVAKVLPKGAKCYMYKTKSGLYITTNSSYVKYEKEL